VSRVDVTLAVGALSETVTVASETQLLQTDKADVYTELKSEAITNLPLAQYRNYQSLMNLVPGATPTQFQNALTDSPGRSLPHVRATARTRTATTPSRTAPPT
jgi:hypothetical protein